MDRPRHPVTLVKVNTLKDHFNFLAASLVSVGSTATFLKLGIITPTAFTIGLGVSAAITTAVLAADEHTEKPRVIKKNKAFKFLTQKITAAALSFVTVMQKINLNKYTSFKGTSFHKGSVVDATKENLKRYDANPQLLEKNEEMAIKFGLKKPAKLKIITNKDKAGFFTGAGQQINAFAYNLHGVKECSLTASLLEKFTDDEELGVLGHENAHVAASHSAKGLLIHFPTQAISLATWGAFAWPMLTTPGGLVTFSANILAHKLIYEKKIDDVDMGKTSLENYSMTQKAAMAAVMLTVPTLTGQPELTALWLTNVVAKNIHGLNTYGFSRANEYQADRGSAEVTNLPHAFISGLLKMKQENMPHNERPYGKNDGKRSSLVNRTIDKIHTLYRTHPSIDSRIKRLEKIALQQEQAFTPS